MDESARNAALSHEVSRRTLFQVAGLGASAGWLAARGAGPAAAQTQQKVTVVLPEEPPDLDPFYYALSHIPVTRNIYESLLQRDPQSPDLLPGLATEWSATSPTTWRFILRQGVKFHNGAPFNADAAAWTVNWVLTQKTQATGNFIAGTTAKAVDEVTLDVTTPVPDPILPRRIYLIGMPEPQSFQADPTAALRTPIGTGPYKLIEYKGGDRITVEAFPDYWGDKPTVTGAEFVYRTESSVRVSMISAGEADIARDIAPQDAAQTRSVAVTIPETPFLRLDVPSPPLDDIRIRQAMDCAVDREELAKTVFGGYAEPAGQIITSSVVGYNPDLKPTAYDPDKAKGLVEAAKADGAPVDLQLTIFGRNGIYPNAAEAMDVVQAWYQAIGLNVTVNMMDVKPWTDIILQQPIPADRRGILQSSAGNEIGDVGPTVNGYFVSTGSQSPLRDTKIDEMQAAAEVLDGDARNKAYQDILKYIQDTHLPFIYLVHTQAIYALSERTTWQPRTDNLILLKEVQLAG
ncbi:MAG TPA: ABC transporter substrate-binding protein [Thermomicrobiales bacterium]|jgi:peptide/nickel transport system substrate-binding protein